MTDDQILYAIRKLPRLTISVIWFDWDVVRANVFYLVAPQLAKRV